MDLYFGTFPRVVARSVLSCAFMTFVSCGGGGSTPSTPVSVTQSPISLALSATSATLPADGTSTQSVTANITRPSGDTASVSLSVVSAPTCLNANITSPGSGSSGTVVFTAPNCTPAGTWPLTIQASDGTTTASATYKLTVAIVVSITQRSNGSQPFTEAMSTSFQPAEWDYTFFQSEPQALPLLNGLNSHHVRLQPVSEAVPEDANQNWDFTKLNAILEPVATQDDKSPELQLATAPAWMNDSNGHLLSAHFQDFANYAADVVAYYNTTTGFTDSQGVQHVHATYTPITYWGIFNEPNYNGLTADQYVQLYNLVAPAMLAASSNVPIKLVGLELGDYYDTTHQAYITAFAQNVTEHVDVVATHYYSTCNQSDTDATVMATVTNDFLPEFQFLAKAMQGSPNSSIASAPLWVTENNVDADFAASNGYSTCNPSQKFVSDARGTSAFFAAWRPYVFSQLGKAGNQALYHWDFDADQQYGEVNFNNGAPYLSYWVDQALENYFCGNSATTCSAPTLLNVGSTEVSGSQTMEALATEDSDQSVTVMLVDHAVNSSTDNNGSGAPRTVIVDLSALPAFSHGTQLTIDSSTSMSTQPTASSIQPSAKMTFTLNGYGVTFLHFTP